MDANYPAQPPIMPYYPQQNYPNPSGPPPPAQGGAPGAPGASRPPQGTSVSIWAGDLDSYMDETFLRNAVAACGWSNDITRIKVVRDRYNGMHAGYGFLDAASPEAAARVLSMGSGMPIPGTNRCWRLNMGRNAQGGGSQSAGTSNGSEINVYIGDLALTITDFDLMSIFRPRFPSTRHAKVVCNDYGQSRGFGFVRFADSGEADRAVQEMSGFMFHNKPIRLSPANGRAKGGGGGGGGGPGGYGLGHGLGGPGPRGGAYPPHGGLDSPFSGPDPRMSKRPRQTMAPDDPNNTTLFIGGTGPHVTEDILWREFSIFGELDAVRVPVNKTGFAFVRFKSRETALAAKDDLSGTHFISLNQHKPVRLEWAAEQLAITNAPSVGAASMGNGAMNDKLSEQLPFGSDSYQGDYQAEANGGAQGATGGGSPREGDVARGPPVGSNGMEGPDDQSGKASVAADGTMSGDLSIPWLQSGAAHASPTSQ